MVKNHVFIPDEADLIYDIHGFGHLYIKQCFEIGKIKWHFVDGKDSKKIIDVYMNPMDAKALCRMILRDYNSLEVRLEKERAKGQQWPEAAFTSNMSGGKSGNDIVARQFSLNIGAKSKYVLQAKQMPATRAEDGKTVPLKKGQGNESLRFMITVAVQDYFTLMGMAEAILSAVAAYERGRFTMENMLDSFRAQRSDNYQPARQESEYQAYSQKAPVEQPVATPMQPVTAAPAQDEKKQYHMKVLAKTPVAERKSSPGDYSMQVTSLDGDKTYNVVFRKEDLKDDPSWAGLKKYAPTMNGVPIRFGIICEAGQENGINILYFKDFEPEYKN